MNEQEILSQLKSADWLQRSSVRAVFDLLDGDKGHVRAVGGIVRNSLLGEERGDVDMASIYTPEEVMARAERAGIKAVPTGIDHGTVTLVIEDDAIEVTTLRKDVRTDGRHAEVAFGTDWEEDAKRRDFTMNALYVHADGTLYDPLGGLHDCLTRQVHFIGDAAQRIEEDYLRILRFFRFFAIYGSGRPEANGLKAAAKLKGGIEGLSAERIWAEFKKLLKAKDPSRALLWMRTAGILALVLPEGEKWGIDAIHGLVAAETELDWSIDPMLRLISILPPQAPKVKALSKRLKLSKQEQARLVDWAMVSEIPPETTTQAFGQLLYWGNVAAIIDRLRLDLARLRNKLKQDQNMQLMPHIGALSNMLEKAQNWQQPIFPVSGADLKSLGVAQGVQMGKMLMSLETYWVEKQFQPEKEELLGRAKAEIDA